LALSYSLLYCIFRALHSHSTGLICGNISGPSVFAESGMPRGTDPDAEINYASFLIAKVRHHISTDGAAFFDLH
jgi:hypothetical protein